MPRGRRHHTGQPAGSLVASRLPLGTPSLTHHNNNTAPAEKPGEAALYSTRTSFESDTATSKSGSGGSSYVNLAMADTRSDSNDQALNVSLAAAKLERQKKRIEEANAALDTQFPSEKQKQAARNNKGKAWKPFDFATELNATSQTQMANAPVVETRVNVFRAPSQGASLSRPMSRISTNTHTSTTDESERRDSQFLESDDFQLFVGPRKSRPAVPAFDEKSSAPNATVEAAFSKRDITEVFGNELPRSGFMDGNPGSVDGQLQFIQHPNGDVSAHQWSASRFGWENIGQFSYIRKKVEGQLAADRLKGETAWQSLQQNTLAYFRAVAKQREADAMGLPFGAKEIAGCLPDVRPPSTAPTGPRRITSKVEMPERPENMMPRQDFHASQPGFNNTDVTAGIPPKPTLDMLPQAQGQSSQPNSRFNPSLNFTPTPRENFREDPFAFAKPTGDVQRLQNFSFQQNSESHYSYYQPWVNPMSYAYAQPWTCSNTGYQQTYEQMKQSERQEQNRLAVTTGQGFSLSHHESGHQQTQEQFARSVAQQAVQQPALQGHAPSFNYSAPLANLTTDHAPSVASNSVASVQSKTAAPLESCIVMREQVMKMGEQAKERTKSQANIGRTVLYDPFQDQSKKDPIPSEPTKEELPAASISQSGTLGHFPSLGLNMIPGLSAFSGNGQDPFPTALAPLVKLPPIDTSARTAPRRGLFNQTSDLSECDLRDSSPDREWGRQSRADSQELPMPIHRPSFLKQWDTEQLDEWLWSGNKFARQEDFHQRIMATDALSTRRTHPTTASAKPIAPPPIGTPSRFKLPSPSKPPHSQSPSRHSPTPQSNILTNRLLVPVLENLASYVQGPVEKRRDYFCPWVKAPDWAVDRGPNGNDSFFDSQWGQPPARVGRDPRYQPLPRGLDVRFGNFDAPRSGQTVAMPLPGLDRRFGYGGRF
jgi:hypothetical protein